MDEVTKLIEIKFGSHLYGTATENSDLDIKGIYLPSKEQLKNGRYPKTIQSKRKKLPGEKNTKDDVDYELFSLDRFIELLYEGQTMGLDMLFAPESSITYVNPEYAYIWEEIRKNKDKMLSRNVTAFVGYARKQAAKYGVKGSRIGAVRIVLDFLKSKPLHDKLSKYESEILSLIASTSEYVSMEKTPLVEIVELPVHKNGPMTKYISCCGRKVQFTNKIMDAMKVYQRVFEEYGTRALQAETNQGVDFKALSHAVRVNCEAIELLNTGKITLPLPNSKEILAIKKGEVPYGIVATAIEVGLKDLEAARAISALPDKPDYSWATNFANREYRKIYRFYVFKKHVDKLQKSIEAIISKTLRFFKVRKLLRKLGFLKSIKK